jgi:flavin reductase (DIM6/NTAB) family NADH-FMN oxidoreductase RutF
MARQFYSYEPAKGHGLPHNPFNALVAPRPIGWISSRDAAGHVNLAPHSFFNAFCYTPPIVGFSSTGWKDTARNAQETGEFGWSLVTKPLAEAMNVTSARVPHGVNEFELAGLTEAPSRLIRVPRVAESPVSFECKLTQMFRLKTKEDRETESWMIFGEVVAVYIDQTLLKDGIYQTGDAYPVVRSGGPGDYFDILPENKFVMARPRA